MDIQNTNMIQSSIPCMYLRPPLKIQSNFINNSLTQIVIQNIRTSVIGEFPAQRPVMRSFDVFFDLRLNKWFSKQAWGWWLFETPRAYYDVTVMIISDRQVNVHINGLTWEANMTVTLTILHWVILYAHLWSIANR